MIWSPRALTNLNRLAWALGLSLIAVACGSGDPADDADGDGFGVAVDCDDADPAIHPGAEDPPGDGIDQNCDGMEDPDGDGDGFDRIDAGGDDCDDSESSVHPEALEVPYDGVDQDCDGEDAADLDGDGYDALEAGGDDCDDTREEVNPAGVDRCDDFVDQDCTGMDEVCGAVDQDGDGFAPDAGDCNDGDPAISPGADEITYNDRDDDCDPDTPDNDLDEDGVFHPGDCDDTDPAVRPGADEVAYDGIDQDCDGVDLTDVDRDGYDGTAAGGDDCDDTRDDVNPGILETPYNSLDENCDGSDFFGSAMQIAASSSNQVQPAIAYGSGKHLIVWMDNRANPKQELWGVFVNALGAELSDPFLIQSGTFKSGLGSPTLSMQPQVASDGSGFMVVWQQYFDLGAGGGDVAESYAVPVSADGTVGIAVSLSESPTAPDGPPDVVYAGDNFLTCWRIAGIWTRPISTDGTPGITQQISTDSSNPRLATDGNSVLATWTATGGMYGRLLNSDGTPARAATILSTTGTNDRRAHGRPSGGYLLTTGGVDVSGRVLDSSGDPVGASFPIGNAIGNQSSPDAALLDGAFSVIFVDNRWGRSAVYTQRVDADGTAFGTDTDRNAQFYAGPAGSGTPRIASDGTDGLVVWSTDGDIFVQTLRP